MVLKCSSVCKDLSAFLDDELNPRRRRQVELHISECENCRREAEKLREMIGFVGSISHPEVPIQLWKGTRQKLEAASEQSTRRRIFGIPKWSFIPAGAAVSLALLYLLAGQLFFPGYGTEAIPVDVYVEEYTLSSSEQVLSPDPLPGLTIAQTERAIQDTQSDLPMSELEMLMEVHYGTNPTNGS